jgi:hypothetical protein
VHRLPPFYARYLLGLLLDPEDGSRTSTGLHGFMSQMTVLFEVNPLHTTPIPICFSILLVKCALKILQGKFDTSKLATVSTDGPSVDPLLGLYIIDRLERIPTMVYVVPSYWACFGLYPSSCMWNKPK